MPLASYLLSFCLHAAVILLVIFWPAGSPLINVEQPVMISLVDGAPGGNSTPSPIQGHMGDPGEGEIAPTPPAQKAEVAAHAREETHAAPVEAPKDVVPMKKEELQKPELKPEPKPKPKEDAIPEKKEQKKEKRDEKKDDKPKPQEEKKDKKQTNAGRDKKDAESRAPKKDDSVAAALNQARRQATSRTSSGDRGNSVEQALAEARRRAGGNRGGGGGRGAGPGGGGLNAVYISQVMLAVRPNWGYASGNRQNFQCTVHISVSRTGEVTKIAVTSRSGNSTYDNSCVNAIMRTSRAGDFPPPPSPEYEELDLVFTLNDFARVGR